MAQVIAEIESSDFVLLIDDFHYMDRNVQAEVAKQISRRQRDVVSNLHCFVPRRSDDLFAAILNYVAGFGRSLTRPIGRPVN